MIIRDLPIRDAFLVESEPYCDERGIFARFFCENELKKIIGGRKIVNVNFSVTIHKGSVRGLHFQYPPKAEMKFVRCISGKVFDVLIDIRNGSPTFLGWYAEELSPSNLKMLVIPEGFAHGFQTLTDNCCMLYLHTEFYGRTEEGGLHPNDPAINITWPLPITHISEKDAGYLYIKDEKFTGIKI